jgi:PST family polysaccharide transporter
MYFSLDYFKNTFFGTPNRKKLTENFLSLSILHVMNYIFPLITVLYIIRVLGPAQFGLLSFAQAVINYFVIFTDYGFSLSATREIAIENENKEKVGLLFWSTFWAKVFLGLISFLILILIISFIPRFSQNAVLYLVCFGAVLGTILFPVWFFQGMEKMRYITIVNFISRLVFTILIFFVVKTQADILKAAFLYSIGLLIGGIFSLIIIFRDFKIKFLFPRLQEIYQRLKEGWHLFLTQSSITLYTTTNTFLLGILTNNNTLVGYYSGTDKIIQAGIGLIGPISTTIFPYMSRTVRQSKKEAIKILKKLLKFMSLFGLCIFLGLFILAPWIVRIILGNQYTESIILLRILSVLPFIVGINNVCGLQTLVTFGYSKEYSKIFLTAGILNIILALIAIPLFQDRGIAGVRVITETFVVVLMFIILNLKGVKLFSLEFNTKL